MNNSKINLGLIILAFSVAGAINARAENKSATNTVSTNMVQIRSIFIAPTSNKEGRDPFFPESTRLADAAASTNHVPEITSLKVPGIFGTPDHRLAIINNHTFAVGEEGDVLTATGRIHLKCVDIQADAVVVEVNGQQHRIRREQE
jgi:hypothetical protein